MTGETPEWRVTFWFLSGAWVQLGFAFVKARSEQQAVAQCAQGAAKFGLHVNGDTKIEVRPETGDGRL